MLNPAPYAIDAFIKWILDSGDVPELVVGLSLPEAAHLTQLTRDENLLILNVSPTAVRNFEITQEAVLFNTRFNGVATNVYVPMSAILAIRARHSLEGMVLPRASRDKTFSKEQESEGPKQESEGPKQEAPSSRPQLKVVK